MSTPILFTIDGSGRHEVISLKPSSTSMANLSSAISGAAAGSPNCEEFMSKYKSAKEESVTQVRVRWCTAGRDSKAWPSSTILHESNCAAVLSLMDPAKDTLEVKMRAQAD
ncbi:hypothetical protein BDY21DRAFT_291947 [Lineolata rhizophorae]|uniref:Uncharacterized protein n=1 Tax=Lineolata rhizophorae TaxID=578093 RepID=A0A6A6NQF4_9PEZI|nr:hypothetical protein BDY21DRAFT_291947 [Lineolata rhizophorae]